LKAFIDVVGAISAWAIPVFLVLVPLWAAARKVKVFTAFVEGAKQGFEVGVRIIPYLVAILTAVGAFRGSGAMDLVTRWLAPVTERIGVPASVLPLFIVRPLSGGAATGLLADLIHAEGPDSLAARIGAVAAGSTETTFYVLAVYFGAVGVSRYRHAIPAALLAEITGFTASVIVVHAVFG
jgi:spore maturation protein B